MLRNYFTIAWRNILRSKGYSAITIFGLAAGMAVALLIGLWTADELSFDTYHANYDRLAQVMATLPHNGVKETSQAISLPMEIELRNKRTDLFAAVSASSWNGDHILVAGDKKMSSAGIAVQPEFPSMLSLHMLKGSREALKDPSSILLNASVAKALFGNEDPMGRTMKLDNKTDLKVAGVFEDLPHNTTLRDTYFMMAWDEFVAMNSWLKEAATQWGNHSLQAYVQLRPGVTMAQASLAIRDITKPHEFGKEEDELLQPMKNWHLYNDFKEGKVAGGSIQFVWLFGIIGVFVLLLACINFMNLSTARSEKRAREIGIRKTLGSMRGQLIRQLLSESVLVALLALIMAILLVKVSLPVFNDLSGKAMSIPWLNPFFWAMTLGFALFTGLLSGSYPALYLSSFDPIRALKGRFKAGPHASLPRKILVVLQFTVSITLIIGTLIVFRQIQYAENRPIGYNPGGLITLPINTSDIYGHYNALRSDLLRTGVVEDMSESSSEPTQVNASQIGFNWKGKDPHSVPVLGTIAVTHDYGRTMGWQIIQGRDFSRDFPTDTGAYILNQAAVKLMGIKDPVGQTIFLNDKKHVVAGIIKDMVMESPYTPVQPTAFFLDYGWTQVIMVRLKPSMPVQDALARIEPVFRKYNPGSPFQYSFTDETYAKKFYFEQRIGHLAAIFASLAIFISCLGLLGLASFVAEQRTREMGVRKVLGASLVNIWSLLSKEFLLLVILSSVISTPLAWYGLHRWLQQYEYRTTITWQLFFVAGCGALLITILTVSYQAIRTALANPVKSLRTE